MLIPYRPIYVKHEIKRSEIRTTKQEKYQNFYSYYQKSMDAKTIWFCALWLPWYKYIIKKVLNAAVFIETTLFRNFTSRHNNNPFHWLGLYYYKHYKYLKSSHHSSPWPDVERHSQFWLSSVYKDLKQKQTGAWYIDDTAIRTPLWSKPVPGVELSE